ncbi:tyrosine-type recombinase/integrase [Streptomyces sp. NPDC058989]|uniref:tyrosine-type recombinase/integrase n=1 Tax=Streptomyces sp. NPDC058989 TaxID=3346686 RepID=UPI0036CA40A0
MAGKKRRFGAIRKLPSGRHQARYPGPDGVMRPAPETFRTKTDAERWLVKIEAQISEGRWLDPSEGRTTVADWADRWYASASTELKPKTRSLYEGLIRLWIKPQLGAYPLNSVRPITVAEWIAGLRKKGLSASRIRSAYRVFSQIMRSAVDNDMIAVTPCRGVKIPRLPDTEPHILTDEEVRKLIGAMTAPHDLLVKLLAYAGLRIGEAFALRRKDVLLDHGLLIVDEAVEEINGHHAWGTPKSHQKRILTMPGFLVADLRDHLKSDVGEGDDALLFVGGTGKVLRYNDWRRAQFDKAVKKAGLSDVTPHDLRATHATWVADRHGVMAAAKRLGHSNASVTTRHYARVVDGRDADVAKTMHSEHQAAAGAGKAANGTPYAPDADLARSWHEDDDDGAAGALVPA